MLFIPLKASYPDPDFDPNKTTIPIQKYHKAPLFFRVILESNVFNLPSVIAPTSIGEDGKFYVWDCKSSTELTVVKKK